MRVGDTEWWMTVGALVLAAIPIVISVRSAVGGRQRELRGRLREVLRDVSKAVHDYPIEDFRRTSERVLVEASQKIEVIRDEGILSPKPRYLFHLQYTLYDLGTREEAFLSAENDLALVMPPDRRAQLRPNFDLMTARMLKYVTRVSDKYRAATRKMDNGCILTYWHYRLLPPYIRRDREPRRSPPLASEE